MCQRLEHHRKVERLLELPYLLGHMKDDYYVSMTRGSTKSSIKKERKGDSHILTFVIEVNVSSAVKEGIER